MELNKKHLTIRNLMCIAFVGLFATACTESYPPQYLASSGPAFMGLIEGAYEEQHFLCSSSLNVADPDSRAYSGTALVTAGEGGLELIYNDRIVYIDFNQKNAKPSGFEVGRINVIEAHPVYAWRGEQTDDAPLSDTIKAMTFAVFPASGSPEEASKKLKIASPKFELDCTHKTEETVKKGISAIRDKYSEMTEIGKELDQKGSLDFTSEPWFLGASMGALVSSKCNRLAKTLFLNPASRSISKARETYDRVESVAAQQWRMDCDPKYEWNVEKVEARVKEIGYLDLQQHTSTILNSILGLPDMRAELRSQFERLVQEL